MMGVPPDVIRRQSIGDLDEWIRQTEEAARERRMSQAAKGIR